ncbi:MAG: ATP-binding protein [Kiloniellales bacterium]|nr:ATP-binding protein [Kiloniellales bacterium]
MRRWRPNLRYLTKLTLSFSGLLAIALVCAFMAFWSARSAEHHLERSRLAHRVHEQYLALSSHTYQLFKQFGDALLIGDRDEGRGEAALLKEIRTDISTLRVLIAEEVKLVGEEEIEELELLAQIERQIEFLLREFSRLQHSANTGDPSSFEARLSEILDEEIDSDFQALLAEALAEEQEEVAETEAEMRAAVALYERAAVLAGLIAAVTAIFGILLLRSALTKPLQRLLRGAEAVGQGDLSHRIDAPGDTELDRVAQAFNQMTAKVAERQDFLSASRDALEQEISRRTAQLEKLLKTLQQTESNRKRLLADVSHELRTPLTIIRGEADVALRSGDRKIEEYREVLMRTREAADHTARIVDDLLFVARQESDEVRIQPREVDLAELVERTVEAGRALDDIAKSVTYEAAVAPAKLRADPRRVQQVVTILLENALRYGGQEVHVRLDQTPGGYAVTVADDGPGLTEDELDHVFERFFRGSNAAIRYDGGAGLGLPVAKAIVEAHGGRIALTSAPGEGVQARFTLPSRPRLAAAS